MKRLSSGLLPSLAMALTVSSTPEAGAATFAQDVRFLRQHTQVIVLTDPTGQAQVAVAPQWQGRVMTSTARGENGVSFGWVNRKLIASHQLQPHINVFGGEDRFWLGPEGGQFSIFFAMDAPFDLEHWFTPAPIDTEAYEVIDLAPDRLVCRHRFDLKNYSGTAFQVEVTRTVRLLSAEETQSQIGGQPLSGAKAMAFETINTLRNVGSAAWTKDSGLLSIWILGMFNASPKSTVVVPFKAGPESDLGPAVNDAYFGQVPADRLKVLDGVAYFRADAQHRSKIGVSPRRAKPVLGSYDSQGRALTLVRFTLPEGVSDYVNSAWEIQAQPYGGDVVNSYNDGAPAPGAEQLGRFYELESSSPALALQPGESATHRHLTVHVQGAVPALDQVAQSTLGVKLEDVRQAFAR